VHFARCQQIIEELSGSALPPGFEADYRSQCAELMKRELVAVKDVSFALDHIRIPVCVASNSPAERVRWMLRLAGIGHHFGERILSGEALGKYKPDPALFLKTARTFRTNPAACLVIEDSLVGVQAARSAGMNVLLYAGQGAFESFVSETPAVKIFRSMRDLPALISQSRISLRERLLAQVSQRPVRWNAV
jgi:HAD superfamily hydrolase (TIGR01509 family)